MITDALRSLTKCFVRPYRPRRSPSKMVAIVVPLSARVKLTADEEVSLRHLMHYLGEYDKYLIAPRGLQVEIEGCRVKYFSRKYFGSASAHCRMLYTTEFYKVFEDYKYIFFYHLDSLAFSNQLEEWCRTDVDYIGAPFLHCPDALWVEKNRVGNGGFALLKVESALKVLYNRYRAGPATYWFDRFSRNRRIFAPFVRVLEWMRPCFSKSSWIHGVLRDWHVSEHTETSGRAIDLFWSDQAVEYYPEFKVASFEEGLRFAFEMAPRECFELNGKTMPFGCHAWGRYDRAFWEPHLLPPESPAESEKRSRSRGGSGGVSAAIADT